MRAATESRSNSIFTPAVTGGEGTSGHEEAVGAGSLSGRPNNDRIIANAMRTAKDTRTQQIAAAAAICGVKLGEDQEQQYL